MKRLFFHAALADLMEMNMWNFYGQIESVVNLCLAFNFFLLPLAILSLLGARRAAVLWFWTCRSFSYCKRAKESCGNVSPHRISKAYSGKILRVKLKWNFSHICFFSRLITGQVVVASSEIPSNAALGHSKIIRPVLVYSERSRKQYVVFFFRLVSRFWLTHTQNFFFFLMTKCFSSHGHWHVAFYLNHLTWEAEMLNKGRFAVESWECAALRAFVGREGTKSILGLTEPKRSFC